LAVRLVTLSKEHEQASRIGAAQLGFRERWAILSAAGIYGAIAIEVGRRGEAAWDERVHTSGRATLGFVAKGLAAALMPPPKIASLPKWNRRQLAAMARPAG